MNPLQRRAYLRILGLIGLWLGWWGVGCAFWLQETCLNDAQCPSGYRCLGGICQIGVNPFCGTPCTALLGPCAKGLTVCDSQGRSSCVPYVRPSAEVCDGKDNDCNGKTDDLTTHSPCNLPQAKGPCQVGLLLCKRGKLECSSWITPKSSDICDNGVDDDCNGLIDDKCGCNEGTQQPCYTGPSTTRQRGACRDGVQICQDGVWGPCRDDIKPTAEVCDGKDNDCNGKTDDGLLPPPCAEQRGLCKGSTQTCLGAKGWQPCTTARYQSHHPKFQASESLCDGEDNDCDGQTDEGRGCFCGMGAQEKGVFDRTNQERKKAGLSALSCEPAIVKVARQWSKSMCEQGIFSHQGSSDRAKSTGLSFTTSGELIQGGNSTPEAVVGAWINSSAHRANILNSTFTHAGVGYHKCSKGFQHYWTQIFMRIRQ